MNKITPKNKFLRPKYLVPTIILLILIGYVYHNRDYFKYKLYGSGDDITSIRILGDTDHKTVSFYSDSIKIVGDLYNEHLPKHSPCIVLLHGSSIYGRKLPLIQVLASKFYNYGYTVLSIDLRGYGDSEDPPSLTEKNFDFADDVISAIDFLKEYTSVDTNRIFVVGHSWEELLP